MYILLVKSYLTDLTTLILCPIITPLKYHVFENIMENGTFALLEQMPHFPFYFQKSSKLNLNFS